MKKTHIPQDQSLSGINKQLFEAIQNNDLEKTINSLQQGAETNAQNENLKYPLEIAAFKLNAEIVGVLLEHRANLCAERNRQTVDEIIKDYYEFAPEFNEEWNEFCEKAQKIKLLISNECAKDELLLELTVQDNNLFAFESLALKESETEVIGEGAHACQ